METLEIIRRNGEKVSLFSKEPFCMLKSATQNCTLMGDDNVQLSIVSSELLSFGKGDKITVNGEEYTIRTKVTREMQSDNYYTYEATFYGVMYELMKTIYRNTDADGKSTSSTFDLTYSIADFVKVLIYNTNRDYPGLWQFDEENCPDTEPRTISFSNNNCLQVLQTLCSDDEFKLEFRITQSGGVRTIHIGKFGSKVVPPGGGDFFEWGKGYGIYTLKEKKVDDKTVITRLWVEGGTTNIRSDYRDYSGRLQLPYPKRMNRHEHTLPDGTVISANSEMIGIDDDNKRYIEDAELRDELGSDEDAAQYDDIYPKRTGKVTALVDGDINSFIDSTMDFDLSERDENGNTKWLIDEVSAKITFISGRLAGQQFELASNSKYGYVHSERRFTIIPFTDERGLTIPTEANEAYRINVGDQYKITDINLPKAYEDDAEEDLWYAGYGDFKPRTQAQAQYELSFDRSYFLEALADNTDTCIFHVGDYVPVRDVRFGIEKNIRIQKVTRNLLSEQDYNLTLSDTTAVSIYNQTVVDVMNHEKIIENNNLKDLNKARRGWRTTEELRNMVYDPDGYFNPENIRPNSIDTNMLTVGAKSQQFVLKNVVFQANANGNPNRFVASSGVLSHLTIDDSKIRSWNIGESVAGLESSSGYYLFAKCSKNGDSGTWYLTQEQMKFEPDRDPNNYYFQIGILSSVYPDDNFRDFASTYGYTRINGKTITTGRIESGSSASFFDLDGNAMRLGSDAGAALDFNSKGDGKLRIKGTIVQSQGGDDESYIGCYRGVYNPDYVYYEGDEVSYENDGNTSTYRYIFATPNKGIAPTNTAYWQVVAQGSKGEDGTGIEISGTAKGHYATVDEFSSASGSGRLEDGLYLVDVNGGTYNAIATFEKAPSGATSVSYSYAEKGEAYILETDGHLYVASQTGWKDAGRIQGTSISPKGSCKGHYANYTALKNSGGDKYEYDVFIVDDSSDYSESFNGETHEGYSAPSIMTYINAPDFSWSARKANDGDCYKDDATGHLWVADGEKWKDLGKIKGEDGVGISQVEEFYLISSSESEVTTSTVGWSSDVQTPTKDKRYLWNYEKVTYTDGKSVSTSPTIIGMYSEDGRGIVSVTEYYAISKSNTVAPMLWSAIPPQLTPVYKYLWNYELIKYTDNTSQSTTPVVIGAYGDTGNDGRPGNYVEYRYAKNGSTTMPPDLDVTALSPSGWSTEMPSVGMLEYLWMTVATKSGDGATLVKTWSTPVRVTPYDGKDGADGESPVMVYRGEYDSSKTYYGNKYRLDAVRQGGTYYIARIDAGAFSNIMPPNATKWNEFGAQFESVATQLLLAENANIAGWIFKDGKLFSQNGQFYLNGATGEFGGIIRSALFYGGIKEIKTSDTTPTIVEIKPDVDFATWYIIREPKTKTYITLPKASEWDGLELSFFIKQSNWNSMTNTTHIKPASGDTMLCKVNIYNQYDGQTHIGSFENYDVNFTEDTSYWMMQPNMAIKLKSMFGAWYCTDGVWTGE